MTARQSYMKDSQKGRTQEKLVLFHALINEYNFLFCVKYLLHIF